MWFEKPVIQERENWKLDPLVSVGPLFFGMNTDEVADALQAAADNFTTERGFVRTDFPKARISVYYAERDGLKVTAVSASPLCGPQISFKGAGLTGRLPSDLDPWIDAWADGGHKLLFTPEGEPSFRDLGLLLRLQPNGDRCLTRPILLSSEWLDQDWSYLPFV